MAKTRDEPRHVPVLLKKGTPMPMTKEAFMRQVEEFWDWTASRPRLSVNWWQSLSAFASES